MGIRIPLGFAQREYRAPLPKVYTLFTKITSALSRKEQAGTYFLPHSGKCAIVFDIKGSESRMYGAEFGMNCLYCPRASVPAAFPHLM